MNGIRAAILGLLAASAVGLGAQAQTAGVAISPARLALARQVVEVGKFDRAMALAVDVVLGPFIQQINAGAGTPEFKAFAINLLKSETATMEARVTPKIAEIYAEEFTEPQLKDLLAFYESPTGQALTAKQGELSVAGQRAVAPLIPEMQADLVDKMFAHICETRRCTPAERQKLDAAKAGLMEKLAADRAAPSR